MGNQINVIVTGLKPQSVPCVFRTVVLKSNMNIFSQMTEISTKYVIKWNYDLEGNTLTVPIGCILDFDGGQLQNGSIQWSETKVFNPYKYEILKNITESGEKIEL